MTRCVDVSWGMMAVLLLVLPGTQARADPRPAAQANTTRYRLG